MQKLIRAGFGNNNVDTCARVCHSPTGYGLKTTFGTSAGTQDFDSVDDADVILVIGAMAYRRASLFTATLATAAALVAGTFYGHVPLLVWALFFLWQGAITDASNAYYFSLMQYTTVGSRYNLPPRWRLLDGMLPIAGLMTLIATGRASQPSVPLNTSAMPPPPIHSPTR